MNGAGGSSGGIGQFFIGVIMMCGGFYLLLNSITVSSNFGLSSRLFGFGNNFGVTGGMIMIPFIFGIGLVFFNAKNILGWLLTLGSITALIFGVISSVRFNLRTMTTFELIVILVLAVGGLGLFLRSLKKIDAKYS
ncbi:hypothetical protein [uncultured Paraglaciecola sp.]|jgi:hypothetical protein|uniref:hypothetical protein n=1 Tax=uncultured Paraglaciecola sp. TaxID=1765024 RepID=UPI0030DD649A|tara:strand:+ start:158446 stop:158853 length:408 start_codon:yes stop_codon:yes gene_type:complete